MKPEIQNSLTEQDYEEMEELAQTDYNGLLPEEEINLFFNRVRTLTDKELDDLTVEQIAKILMTQ